MGKQTKALLAQLQAAIANLQKPEANPAQNYLTNEALAGGEFLKKGDFSQLPKGMFFDFQMPGEQLEQYKKLSNVSQDGTFALSDNGGRSMGLASKYLGDKFARDASQNYQNNIAGAAGNIRNSLAGAAGAKTQNDMGVINALGNLYSTVPKGNSWLGSLLQGIGQVGGAAMAAYGGSGGM